jgi:hypothetical protein
MKIRRINLYGAPGSGKSTVASFLFYNLKIEQYQIELVNEYIKWWTYIPRVPVSWDSYYCQAKQITKEDVTLRSGTDLIVSDSPILLGYFYGVHHNTPGQEAMLKSFEEFQKMYPSIDILIKRPSHIPYNRKGRYEDEKDSNKIEIELTKVLVERVPFKTFFANETDAILKYVLFNLESNN